MFVKNIYENYYQGQIIRLDMNNWLIAEKSKKPCPR
jgi:hypothetical protein